MIFFNPFLLRNWGEVRTLHHVKERLSFFTERGRFCTKKRLASLLVKIGAKLVIIFLMCK